MKVILSPWKDDWRTLALSYRFPGVFRGKLLRFKTAWMGSLAVQPLRVDIGVNMEGFYIRLALFFLWSPSRYPPLFIPWNDIAMTKEEIYRSCLLTIHAAKASGITFQIEQKVGDRLAGQAGALWPEIKETEP
jgi:hypothetical protein